LRRSYFISRPHREVFVDKPSGPAIELETLKALLKEILRELLKQRSPDKPFTRPELIKHLGIGTTTFDRLERKGLGPRKTKLSERRICYLPHDVRAWQEKRKV
jgi:predicted DNA-binding transcriptional regulator AlpA